MPRHMTKAELKRRVAEADSNTNHFTQLSLKIEAIVEYLMELPGPSRKR